jgi:phage terminase large subunit
MTSLITSLRSLPPKQALALLLAEKARRVRTTKAAEEATLLRYSKPTSDADAQGSIPETSDGAPSLVLDRSLVYSCLYYEHADYIVLWGGRGAAKTWAVAEALVRKAAATALLIGCAREFQNSIRDSSHRVIKNTIERLGLQAWFTVTAETIRSRSGSEFIFKGLSNPDSLRSLEGCDILWIEEAQSVAEASWRAVIPTIRKAGAMIWVTFNLMDEKDATYQRFVVHKTADMIVHKVNFDSNPFFGGKLERDMLADKARDYHLYEHIWLGMPLRISDAIIFNRKYVVERFPEDLWEQPGYGVVIPHYGIDWGYAQDPMAAVRNFALEKDDWWKKDGKRRLFISHVAMSTGIDLGAPMVEFLDRLPGSREWPWKADNAQPAMISDVRNKGFTCSAAEKWKGSVEDGIAHLRGFDEIVIQDPHAVDCPVIRDGLLAMAEEARLYRYKVDPRQVDQNGQPQVLPIIVDKFNHGWDATRYSRDGYITKGGDLGIWARLGQS